MNALPPVLVVEDSDEDFHAIERVIRSSGLAEVVRAESGDMGLDLLRASSLGETALMILLDLNTPGSDGRDILREIKQDAVLRKTPVVVFTTSSNPRDVEGCYQDGANSYHLKPLGLREFESVVMTITEYWMKEVYQVHLNKG